MWWHHPLSSSTDSSPSVDPAPPESIDAAIISGMSDCARSLLAQYRTQATLGGRDTSLYDLTGTARLLSARLNRFYASRRSPLILDTR